MYHTTLRPSGTLPGFRRRPSAFGRTWLSEIAFGAIELSGQELDAATGGAGFGLGAREPVPSSDLPPVDEPLVP